MATSHEVDYQIYGDDMQFVEIELDPGETVIAEAGAMMYLDDGIEFEAVMGDGSEPDQGMFGKLVSGGAWCDYRPGPSDMANSRTTCHTSISPLPFTATVPFATHSNSSLISS